MSGDPGGDRPYQLEIVSDEEIGRGGFLHLRRLRLHNVRPDGTRSRQWVCDFVERRTGIDAVVLVLWRRAPGGMIEVLLRDGLRPALHYGRPAERLPLPDPRPYFLVTEVVAGVVEEGERGEAAFRRRAVDEAWEEAGYRVAPEAVELLGAGAFPSPGMTAEKFWFAAAEVPWSAALPTPQGDGSPMEEGARIRWAPLDGSIAACERGEIEDAKTELSLRRLASRLAR